MFRLSLMPTALLIAAPMSAMADPSLECSISNGSQVEIADCVAAAETAVDAAIDIALGFAVTSAKDLDQITGHDVAAPALEAAQSAWSAYRDAHCNFVGSTYGGGSGAGIAIRSCRITLGRDRVTDLIAHVQ